MATFTVAVDFLEDIAEKVHNLGADTLTLALSPTAPTAETPDPLTTGNGTRANLTGEITYTNYTDDCTVDRVLDGVTSAEAAGTYKLDADDVVITASGGAIADFRYVYLWNDSATSPADAVIGVWDHGSTISLATGESATIQWNASGILTIS